MEIEIYRVRKTRDDIASQKGAFLLFENAVCIAKKTKCNVYNNEKICVWKYGEGN